MIAEVLPGRFLAGPRGQEKEMAEILSSSVLREVHSLN